MAEFAVNAMSVGSVLDLPPVGLKLSIPTQMREL